MSLTVPDFSTVNVLTVGDLILDQYWFGPTSRISPEALVPVVNISSAQAVNLAALGFNTLLVGLAGAEWSNGGSVKVLSCNEGRSTASIIAAIRKLS